MILGILSDTHGRVGIARRAVELLLARRAEFVIHCGDVGDGVAELLPAGRSAFVFGNNDWDTEGLTEVAGRCGIRCLQTGGAIELAGRSVAVTHGDVPRIVNDFFAGGVDYLFTGHSHVAHDRRQGKTRWVNPGALQRAARKSVAVLDLTTDDLSFHEVADG